MFDVKSLMLKVEGQELRDFQLLTIKKDLCPDDTPKLP